MSLMQFLKVLRQRWWIILICTVIGGAVMWLITPARTDTTQRVGSYTATATLLVGAEAAPAPAPRETAPPVQYQAAAMGRIALFITTGEVPKRAAAVLGYTGEPALLASGLTVTGDGSSQSITIAATAADGQSAANVANAFANESIRFFDESPVGAEHTRLSLLQEAIPLPNQATGGFVIPPDRTIRTVIGAAIGLLFGLALALIFDRIDSRLRTRDEVHEGLQVPVIAEVPRLPRKQRSGRIQSVLEPLSIYADGYRAARSAVMHTVSHPVHNEWDTSKRTAKGSRVVSAQVVLVTSGHAGEGKTTSAANLAASFAETGKRVLVLDADLRSPDTHTLFDVPQGAGISDFLTAAPGASIGPLMRPTNVPGVKIMTAGTRLDYPASLTSRLEPLLDQARDEADIIVVDCAPLLAASDTFDILPLADAIVLVARSGRLTETAARRVSELLGRFQVPVTGTILIGAPIRKVDGYGANYGYGAARGKGKGVTDRRHPDRVAPTALPEAPNDPAPPRRGASRSSR